MLQMRSRELQESSLGFTRSFWESQGVSYNFKLLQWVLEGFEEFHGVSEELQETFKGVTRHVMAFQWAAKEFLEVSKIARGGLREITWSLRRV